MTEAPSLVRNTIERLKLLRDARAQGYPVAFTTDPTWLVDMAINRRAGWSDDPSDTRGSARPLANGEYPKKARGDIGRWLTSLVIKANIPRCRMHVCELGPWRRLFLERFPERFDDDDNLRPEWFNPNNTEATSLNYALATRRKVRRRLRRLARGKTIVQKGGIWKKS